MWGDSFAALGLVYALLLSGSTSGQTTNTTSERNSTTSFLFNEQDESPWCVILTSYIHDNTVDAVHYSQLTRLKYSLIWAKLQALCVPETVFINVRPLIDHTYGYNSPGQAGTACQCNLVAYSLMVSYLFCIFRSLPRVS